MIYMMAKALCMIRKDKLSTKAGSKMVRRVEKGNFTKSTMIIKI